MSRHNANQKNMVCGIIYIYYYMAMFMHMGWLGMSYALAWIVHLDCAVNQSHVWSLSLLFLFCSEALRYLKGNTTFKLIYLVYILCLANFIDYGLRISVIKWKSWLWLVKIEIRHGLLLPSWINCIEDRHRWTHVLYR